MIDVLLLIALKQWRSLKKDTMHDELHLPPPRRGDLLYELVWQRVLVLLHTVFA